MTGRSADDIRPVLMGQLIISRGLWYSTLWNSKLNARLGHGTKLMSFKYELFIITLGSSDSYSAWNLMAINWEENRFSAKLISRCSRSFLRVPINRPPIFASKMFSYQYRLAFPKPIITQFKSNMAPSGQTAIKINIELRTQPAAESEAGARGWDSWTEIRRK